MHPRTVLAFAAIATVFVSRGARAQADGGSSSSLTVTLARSPAYTGIPRLEIDAAIGDDVEVQSVDVVVQAVIHSQVAEFGRRIPSQTSRHQNRPRGLLRGGVLDPHTFQADALPMAASSPPTAADPGSMEA